jgi:hypothetical protein
MKTPRSELVFPVTLRRAPPDVNVHLPMVFSAHCVAKQNQATNETYDHQYLFELRQIRVRLD